MHVEVAKDADLMLYVVDSSTLLDENDEEIIEMLKDRKAIVLYNKTDLASAVSMEALEGEILPSSDSDFCERGDWNHPACSYD